MLGFILQTLKCVLLQKQLNVIIEKNSEFLFKC